MTNDIAAELEKLKSLQGSSFVKQLKLIAARREFRPVKGEPYIFTTGGETAPDYQNLFVAAKIAVEFGYRVYILPNPQGKRTADFIFEQKGNYKLYELKTPTGKSSVETRLADSSEQSNRALLNMPPDYSTRMLTSAIKRYFETNQQAL